MVEVTLRPMTAEEFDVYLPWAKAEYATEIELNNGIPPEDAVELAGYSFRDLEPLGLDTPGHALWVATDPGTGERIGLLWLTVQQPRGIPAMWIYDIYVEEPLRGKGYARRLLEFAENEARRAGVSRMELNVARDNAGARALYESIGYREMSRQMYKVLSEP